MCGRTSEELAPASLCALGEVLPILLNAECVARQVDRLYHVPFQPQFFLQDFHELDQGGRG